MTDMFGWWVPTSFIDACFGIMGATPQHTHQVLTKRVDRAAAWSLRMRERHGFGFSTAPEVCAKSAVEAMGGGWWGRIPVAPMWPLPNVHFGISAEDQKSFDERIGFVHSVPAAVHYLSLEPLLGSIKLNATARLHIDWAIVGGESGQSARVTRLEHIRGLVWQCHDAGIPLFLKQIGSRPEYAFNEKTEPHGVFTEHPKGGDPNEWPSFLEQDVYGKRQPHLRHPRMMPGDLWPGDPCVFGITGSSLGARS